MRYFAHLTAGRIVLWCYLIWYLFFATCYFDPRPALWLTSLGLSTVIGIALVISTWRGKDVLYGWQTFRLFLMPFCVSNFAALVKGRGFILVFSSDISATSDVNLLRFRRPVDLHAPASLSRHFCDVLPAAVLICECATGALPVALVRLITAGRRSRRDRPIALRASRNISTGC